MRRTSGKKSSSYKGFQIFKQLFPRCPTWEIGAAIAAPWIICMCHTVKIDAALAHK